MMLSNEIELNSNKFILDPLSVIIKLAILSKKEVGTKISVYNNILYLQEIGIFQGIVRYVFKNNKIDIQYLYNPIEIACKFFLKSKIDQNIRKIFIIAKRGIEKLIETYKEYSIITHTLYFYNSIIQNHLSEKYNEKLFIEDSFSFNYTEELTKKLNEIWTIDKIKMVLNMIDFINIDNELNKSIKCLEEFMIIIDENIKNII